MGAAAAAHPIFVRQDRSGIRRVNALVGLSAFG
jgi:hypothetical protein